MEKSFWRVVCRYGHVGLRKEVSVARYIEMDKNARILEVVDLASDMPGVKSRGILEVIPIDEETYHLGKRDEQENFYLKKLMSFKPRKAQYKMSS
ncbi:hypothetical protein [Neobacillus mesonae]|uniref:hypothetical protein n=1 Tax=Neobacillus mesonae TaxID=1193713 RepID=UPI0025735E1D|nr:hypothetical protein [Neobacillus mesonae]